jgi:DNA invertase Pin-like site-specific DNA recombinase
MGMKIGYARVSTVDQNLALQRDALTAAGCERIFTDEGISGSVIARRGLDAALAALGQGDTLVVWKLDRLGRSLSHLVTVIAELGERGVSFRSLSDPIDTTSAGGRLVMHIMGALAEFERGLIVERTQAGIQAAKKRGVHLGRRPALALAQIDHARTLIERGESPRAVARTMRVGKSTLYRALKATEAPTAPALRTVSGG